MKIRVLNKDPLFDYKEFNMVTLGKEIDINEIKTPKDEVEFWIKQFVCYHSNLRCIHFRIIDRRPKSVVMQLIRATKGHPQPFVESSRPDWNDGKERSSDPYELKLFGQDHTPESFIEMAKQRLCNRTEARTRKAMKEVVDEMKKSDNPIIKAVGYCSHPACWWYKGCPEIKGSCGMYPNKVYDSIIKDYKEDKEYGISGRH